MRSTCECMDQLLVVQEFRRSPFLPSVCLSATSGSRSGQCIASMGNVEHARLDRLKVIQVVVESGLKPGRVAEKPSMAVRQIRLVGRLREPARVVWYLACARSRATDGGMEETAECPDAVGGFAAMAIDRLGCSVVSDATRLGGMPDGRGCRSKSVQSCNRDDEAGVCVASRSDTHGRPRVGRIAASPTLHREIEEP